MAPIQIEPSAYYDDDLLIQRFGFRPAALTKARRAGKLRFTDRGGRVLTRGDWLESWLTAEEVQPAVGVGA